MEIGTRVRLIKEVDNYPTCLINWLRSERAYAE
jgi:hypothetical protein